MKYHIIERNRGPYVFEAPRRNPWPYRITLALCWVVVGLAGAMLLAGMFGMLDGRI